MNVKELIEELEKLPQDYTVCVRDSYGAFQDFNFICKGHTVERRWNKNGESKKFYVLETHYDDDGFGWNSNPVEKDDLKPIVHDRQKEVDEILDVIGNRNYYFTAKTKLSEWEPTITGGSAQDRYHTQKLKGQYWSNIKYLLEQEKVNILDDYIQEMTLVEAAETLFKIKSL